MEISVEKRKEYVRRLLISRTRLLVKNGFFGLLLMNVEFALDEEMPTAATDGDKIYFSPDFLDGLDDKQLDFVLMHEVMHVFALNFNALFTEYDMSATFPRSEVTTYAKVMKTMTNPEEQTAGRNVNALARRNASTVFIMVVSGLILYLVYGVGARDLGERLTIREKRREKIRKIRRALHLGGKE